MRPSSSNLTFSFDSSDVDSVVAPTAAVAAAVRTSRKPAVAPAATVSPAASPARGNFPVRSRVSEETTQAASDAGINEAEILRLLAEYDAVKLQAKLLYARKDQIEATLLDILKPGDQVAMADGRTATIIDNFDCIDKKTGKKRNKVWAPAGVCRFEIDITGVAK